MFISPPLLASQMEPVICLGQQPNGILPKRYFVAKLETARDLQRRIGGRIVWFCHDSDSDRRETRTRIPTADPDVLVEVNFPFTTRLQRRFTPLSHKGTGDLSQMRETLRHHTSEAVVDAFSTVTASTAADACIQMYGALGLLDGIELVRSSDPEFREAAYVWDTDEGWFSDARYEGELVRAHLVDGRLLLHSGGDRYEDIGPMDAPRKDLLSAGWRKRFDWMQSVIGATHYVLGQGEAQYLKDLTLARPAEFVPRLDVPDADLAWLPHGSLP